MKNGRIRQSLPVFEFLSSLVFKFVDVYVFTDL